jgi:hypothetical protein
MKRGLSIIIPFVGEYPQVLFTIQSTAQNMLETDIPFEIIAIDNQCKQSEAQAWASAERMHHFVEDRALDDDLNIDDMFEVHKSIYPTYENRSGAAISACAGHNPWLKYVHYEVKLSHWQAKRVGVEACQYDTLLFLDAHVIPGGNSIGRMFGSYHTIASEYAEDDERRYITDDMKLYSDMGTFHLPLTYKILEWRRSIYKMVIENEAYFTYSFTRAQPQKWPYEVPCMSTCGMMISRKIYDALGGWPKGLGIYGGGENFINYALAVCGYKKWIFPNGTLFHHGEKRDYHYEGDDTVRNRMIAHFLFGGYNTLEKFRNNCRGDAYTLDKLSAQAAEHHLDQRRAIRAIQQYHPLEWARNNGWEG